LENGRGVLYLIDTFSQFFLVFKLFISIAIISFSENNIPQKKRCQIVNTAVRVEGAFKDRVSIIYYRKGRSQCCG
jgi:hypothetical protein